MEGEAKDSTNIQPFTCEICIEPTSKRFMNADQCSHPFCTDCIISYIRVSLNDKNVGRIKCPALTCNHTLETSACAPIIGPKLFVRWMDVLCEKAIVGQKKCYCPYINCNVLILNECGEDPKKSTCPSCKRWFCFQCKSVWHAGFECAQNNQLMDSNDVMFELLVKSKKWKRCPRCRHFIERTIGCPDIKCRCGTRFCYHCGDDKRNLLCSCDVKRRRCQTICRCIICLCVGIIVIGMYIAFLAQML